MARRDPDLLSQYYCFFCGERVRWGDLLRILRTDPGQADFELRESYAHYACMRAAVRKDVPLAFARRWRGKRPYLDDSAEFEGKPCAICGQGISPDTLTRLRIQRLSGPVKRPEFEVVSQFDFSVASR